MNTLACSDAGDNDPRVLEAERLFLRALLTSATGVATMADATPAEFRTNPFPDGGKWRGAVPVRLLSAGLIVRVYAPSGFPLAHRSPRRARNSGLAGLWKLIDPDRARQRLRDLEDKVRRPRPRTLFDFFDLDDGATAA